MTSNSFRVFCPTLTVGVTGGTGFIANTLIRELQSLGFQIITLGREHRANDNQTGIYLDLSKGFNITKILNNVDVLVHCAALAHNTSIDGLEYKTLYKRINGDATIQLAEQAFNAGVKRFIFLSSVNVVGNKTVAGHRYNHQSELNPCCNSSLAKALAEDGLREIAARTGMEVTIIRPPLVYGRGVKANFAAMMRLAARNLPLPLASVRNKRSMVALDNLVDLIVTCVSHPHAGNQTFMVSDDADVSTPELLSVMTCAYGKRPRLLPCPPSFLLLGASVVGKRAVAERLLGSLQVDIEHTKQILGWTPRVKLEDVLKEMVRDSIV